MLLQEPLESPYDLRFNFLGFPVRVAWTFWLAVVVFGYSLVETFDRGFGAELSPGRLPLFLLWAACMFLSILIHELGHALAFRRFGIQSSIVLYHFGGLAIPTASFSPSRSIGGLTPAQNMWISLAGPLAQLLSAVLVIVAVMAAGYRVTVFEMMPGPFDKIPGALDGEVMANPALLALVSFYIFPSVLWALLNLVPVLPLDGGQIARSIVQLSGGTLQQALWISVVSAGLLAVLGFQSGQSYMGILFLMLGLSSFQALQQTRGWG